LDQVGFKSCTLQDCSEKYLPNSPKEPAQKARKYQLFRIQYLLHGKSWYSSSGFKENSQRISTLKHLKPLREILQHLRDTKLATIVDFLKRESPHVVQELLKDCQALVGDLGDMTLYQYLKQIDATGPDKHTYFLNLDQALERLFQLDFRQITEIPIKEFAQSLRKLNNYTLLIRHHPNS
jgi:hypothetical protein